MELSVIDGKVKFMVEQFNVQFSQEQLEKIQGKYPDLRAEKLRILAEDNSQINRIKQIFQDEKIPYQEVDISPTPAQLAKAKIIERKGLTRSKALELIDSDFPADILEELKKLNYSQVDNYINNKVIDLQSAKNYLKRLSKIVLILIKETYLGGD